MGCRAFQYHLLLLRLELCASFLEGAFQQEILRIEHKIGIIAGIMPLQMLQNLPVSIPVTA